MTYQDREAFHRFMGDPVLYPCCDGRGWYALVEGGEAYCECECGVERMRVDGVETSHTAPPQNAPPSPSSPTARAATERSAAIADGERSRDPALAALTDAELLERLRAEITLLVEATRLSRVEAFEAALASANTAQTENESHKRLNLR